jgi:hypothetical protein
MNYWFFFMFCLVHGKTVLSFAVLLVLASSPAFGYLANAQENEEGQEQNILDVNAAIGGETANIRDSNLMVETVAEGLEFPTSIALFGTQ